jgi:predicted MFS family arabinose efflux permease
MYRRYWLGSLGAVGASQLIVLGQGWLIVDKLGGSPLSLGILGAATAVPTIIVNLFGGVLADRLNRRAVLMATSLLSAVLLLVLATLDAAGAVQIWHVVVIAAGMGFIYGIDWPTRNAFFPALIDREHTMSAVALNAMLWQGTRIVAPSVGGIAIALVDTAPVFYLCVLGFAVMLIILLGLDVPQERFEGEKNAFRELKEGVRFIAERRVFTVLILLSYSHMFFGMSYIQLMPLIAKQFDVGSTGLGLLLTVIGVGAVSGTFVTLRLQGGKQLGRSMLGALFIATLLIFGFAVAPIYAVALVMLFLASLANSVFQISAMTALQVRVPDNMRGRVMGIHAITFSMLMLGGLFGGLIADLTNVRVAVAAGALLMTVVVIFVALTQDEVRNLDGRASVEV